MGNMEDATLGTCKIDSKNRITLPPKVLDFLKITNGDLVSIENDGKCLCLRKAYIVVRRNNHNGGGMNGDKV